MPIVPMIVVPARDEEAMLEACCRSLGFCDGRAEPRWRLVIVDNGSRDGTLASAREIASASGRGMVVVVEETNIGHVPARQAGAMACARLAAAESLQPADVLLLQADADTSYAPGYVQAMVRQAEAAGPGHLVEGRSVPPNGPEDECHAFRALEAAVDATLAPVLRLDPRWDVVVDDKVAGLRLSDYLAWGGHRREYDALGDEILAETTRLFMRACATGAQRTMAEAAEAVTSRRRILQDPAVAFATAGFPRSGRWRERWRLAYVGPSELEAFHPGAEAALHDATSTRLVHLLALFGIVPAYFGAIAAQDEPTSHGWRPLLEDLGLTELGLPPGTVLERALDVNARQLHTLLRAARMQTVSDREG